MDMVARSVVGCGRLLNSYRVHPSGVSLDTVGTSCLPSVAMPANRALSRVYPLRGKQGSDGKQINHDGKQINHDG